MSDLLNDTFINLNDFCGTNKINGNISFKSGGVLKNSNIKLYYQNSGEFFLNSSTNSNGDFSIRNIPNSDIVFFLVAHDPSCEHNAVIADNIRVGENVDN